MEARIHVLTLAVNDLERALRFYRDGLGFESAGIVAGEFAGDDINPAGAIATFQLKGGLILAVYPRTELEADAAGRVVGAGLEVLGTGLLALGRALSEQRDGPHIGASTGERDARV